MKVSYLWLASYFEKDLPSAEAVAEKLTFHSFEIEGLEKKGEDTLIDVDVLPNRSSDCLSHRGIAKELSVIFGIPMKHDPLNQSSFDDFPRSSQLQVEIEDPKLCRRYSSAVLKGVKVGPSPSRLSEKLETLGQKSINNIVDATNYVMFDIGQPLHAFDADKFSVGDNSWRINIDTGKEGNLSIKTLDNDVYKINSETLLITDGVSGSVLGIAGIKGGKVAEVNQETTNIIIESANFDPLSVRNTSRRLKLRTDASVRFENEPPKNFTVCALESVIKLIIEIAGGDVEGVVDVYPQRDEVSKISIGVDEVNRLLGSGLKDNDLRNIFDRFGFSYTKSDGRFIVSIPEERPDLTIKEDLIEEVGRVYGYANIKPLSLQPAEKRSDINRRFYYAELIRSFLTGKGFSEVYTYGLREKGKVKLINPLASDKAFMRESLYDGLTSSLDLNKQNAPLLGLNTIKVFEVGTVFGKDDEFLELGIGVLPLEKKKKEENQKNLFVEIKKGIETLLDMKNLECRIVGDAMLINFDSLIKELSVPSTYVSHKVGKKVAYKTFSPYPFALRDISVWTPKLTKPEEIIDTAKEEVGELLVNESLFDTFEKDGRVSHAFHLVFQSKEKTLSEEELTTLMDGIYKKLKEKEGWDVR